MPATSTPLDLPARAAATFGRRFLPRCGLLDLLGHLYDLAHHLFCGLVLANALERALADQGAAGPAAEVHLDHEFRLDPFHASPQAFLLGDFLQRRVLARDLVEPALKIALHLLAPPGADPAGVAQHALLVIAEQQRADQAAALVGGLVADDDQLLIVGAFDLKPIAGATGVIRRIGALRHDALEMQIAGVLEHGRAVGLEVIAEADHAFVGHVGEQRGQGALALQQRRSGQVLAIEVQDIEHIVDETVMAAILEVVLQRGEIRGAVFVDRGNLAVEDGIVAGKLGAGGGDGRKFLGPVETTPRLERHRAVGDASLDAVAVELDLMDPAIAVGRSRAQRREARRDEVREPAVTRAGDFCGLFFYAAAFRRFGALGCGLGLSRGFGLRRSLRLIAWRRGSNARPSSSAPRSHPCSGRWWRSPPSPPEYPDRISCGRTRRPP